MKEIEIYKVVRNVRDSLYSAIVRKNKNNSYYIIPENANIILKLKKYNPNFWTFEHHNNLIYKCKPLLGFNNFENAKVFLSKQLNYYKYKKNIPNFEIWKAIAVKSPISKSVFHWWGNKDKEWPNGTIFCSQIKLTDKVIQYH